ncbi:MAG: right-handed parallel beta-helix repeat-containing protein [Acidobacteriota bacterium]
MRGVLVAVALSFTWLSSQATAYYVDSEHGDDTQSGLLGALGGATPWKTLHRLQRGLRSGDVVHLANGSVWHEPLQLQSGVTYTNYGPADTPKPVIDGAIPLGDLAWRPVSGHIFQADTGLPAGTVIPQVFFNGQRLQRARHPNVGHGDWGPRSRFLKVAADTPGHADVLRGGPKAWPNGADLENAEVYVRNVEFALLHYRVTQQRGQDLKLQQLSNDWPYDIRPGWGYWLENKAWMLDQPGEWFHDPSTQKISIWLPDGSSPSHQRVQAAVLAHGVIGDGLDEVSVQHLTVRHTASDAIVITHSSQVNLLDMAISYAGDKGVSITDSQDCLLDQLTVTDSHAQGIWMGDFRYPLPRPSTRVSLTHSTIKGAGRGYYAHSAVMLGQGGTVSDNRIEDSTYIGLHAWKESRISRNVIQNSCMAFDDCGALYTISRGEYQRDKGYPLDLLIEGNTITNAPGSTDGSPHDGTSTRGIYLDDFSRRVTVKDNVVRDTDVGIHLHFARDNIVAGNLLVGNRWTQLWLQENAPSQFNCRGLSPCDSGNYLTGNTIEDNILVSPLGQAAIWQDSDFDSTRDFAIYRRNRLLGTNAALFKNTLRRQTRWQTAIGGMDTDTSTNTSKVMPPQDIVPYTKIAHPRDFPQLK